MAEHDLNICLSKIDEDRFGIKTAKALVSSVSDVREAMGFCKSHQVELLIARCPVTGLEAAQEMERQGFSLMDTLMYFSHDLKKIPIPEEIQGVAIRRAEPGEELLVKDVAGESFRGYLGHYHADPRLLREECNEVYIDWAYRACTSPRRTGEVFVAESDGRIIGFGTMGINDEREGEGGSLVFHLLSGAGESIGPS
ncbi:MAG TPA: hypothetical protein PLA83_08620 [Deltaproteobacteria bacterium]|nr:hypothetical protein [Deltaproteobacteria bacterium]HQI00988.1 hypothetical protein [Deltaproteobacteria bacterium]